jgi:hypothetical protein
MSKPKKQKKLPDRVEELTSDEVMRSIFGPEAQEALKQKANPEPESDVPPTDRV